MFVNFAVLTPGPTYRTTAPSARAEYPADYPVAAVAAGIGFIVVWFGVYYKCRTIRIH